MQEYAGEQLCLPFTFKGEIHNKCTTSGSDNGAVWCVTEVERNKWKDCRRTVLVQTLSAMKGSCSMLKVNVWMELMLRDYWNSSREVCCHQHKLKTLQQQFFRTSGCHLGRNPIRDKHQESSLLPSRRSRQDRTWCLQLSLHQGTNCERSGWEPQGWLCAATKVWIFKTLFQIWYYNFSAMLVLRSWNTAGVSWKMLSILKTPQRAATNIFPGQQLCMWTLDCENNSSRIQRYERSSR